MRTRAQAGVKDGTFLAIGHALSCRRLVAEPSRL
jgi:hypothetical protein